MTFQGKEKLVLQPSSCGRTGMVKVSREQGVGYSESRGAGFRVSEIGSRAQGSTRRTCDPVSLLYLEVRDILIRVIFLIMTPTWKLLTSTCNLKIHMNYGAELSKLKKWHPGQKISTVRKSKQAAQGLGLRSCKL